MRALEHRVPPLAVVGILGALGWATARAWPALALPVPGRAVVAAGLALAAAGVSIAGVREFRRAGTTVDPTRPDGASVMVTSGVYRRSRNPMYVGFALALLAWAAWLGHALSLATVPLFVTYMNRFQIPPEERVLRERFGDAFDAYARRVPRWL